MIKDSILIDDITKMASAAAGSVLDMKREVEAMIQAKLESYLSRSALVTREEFEIVKAMAEKARAENEALRRELELLKTK
jgi:BMFP domain-containing protein YqiC